MTAEERGGQMMWIIQRDLPPLALKFAWKLGNEVGMCAEVYLTAFTVYAQLVEGLTCTNDLYFPQPKDIQWFREEGIPC